MSLKNRISGDLKAAMKSGDKIRLDTVRMIRAQIIEMDRRGLNREMTEEEEISVLLSASKKRKEAIEEFRKGGRQDLVDKEIKELGIINEYLPKPLTREEVESVVGRIISEAGAGSAKDLGKVMSVAMKELKGKVDGKVVQEIVKSRLGA